MFLCDINDLPDCVKSQVCLFADDCLIYRQIKTPKFHQILQNDLIEYEVRDQIFWPARGCVDFVKEGNRSLLLPVFQSCPLQFIQHVDNMMHVYVVLSVTMTSVTSIIRSSRVHGLKMKGANTSSDIITLIQILLTFTTLWAFSADDKMMLFFLFFPENRIWHFMQIVSLGDNLHGMSNPVFWEK